MLPGAMALLCAFVESAIAPSPAETDVSASAPASSESESESESEAESDDDDARLRRVESEMDRLRGRVDDLEHENAELRQEQDLAFEEREALHERIDRPRRSRFAFGGYVDAGLFWAQGNGSGTAVANGNFLGPDTYRDVQQHWRFFGDPLSTAVNARGEPADLGDSRAIRFDSVDSHRGSESPQGKTSFLLNALNFSVRAGLGEQVVVFGMVDIVPRGRDVREASDRFLGDFVDLKLAYVLWRPAVRRIGLEFYGGKIDSVFGREYRIQESPNRIEVTPSLICRYTCGRPVGVATRMAFFERALTLALSLTNGSTYQETFGLSNEVDQNNVKTGSGRLAYEVPWGHLQIGVSGQLGAQDMQASDLVLQHQYGFDAHFELRGLEMTAEFLRGRAHGRDDCVDAECLDVTGAYGTIGYRALNWLMPYFRADWRDALHRYDTEFVYVSRVVRLTPGLRFEITPNVIVKVQYTLNLEVEVPERLLNDVFTSSFVAHF
jgi:hypothetical protein